MALAAAVLSPAVGASSSSLHPKGLSAQLQDGVVTLSWNAPVDDAEGVTGYQVLRRRPGVDAVGTFHVVADDTATSDVSFVDRCADQPGTAYTYRVKARRGDQLSRWGNYSRVDLAADYVAADPQTGCDPDTGAPPTTTDGDSGNDDGDDGDDGDPDNGDDGNDGVARSAVTVDTSDLKDKQFMPPPDGEEGVVLRSSHPSSTAVPVDWALTPSGLNVGDEFRLLFLTLGYITPTETDIGYYNTYVQGQANKGSTHSAIKPYYTGFRVVGSTADVDARDNTSTTYTATDKGVPIYWMNGSKVADGYEDFYDGTWDNEDDFRDRTGNRRRTGNQFFPNNRVWTGSKNNGTAKGGTYLGAGRVEVGRLNQSSGNPLNDNGNVSNSYAGATPYYALSEVFTVGGADSTPVFDVLSDPSDRLPEGYPNSLGYDPGAPPASAEADKITGNSASDFVPNDVNATVVSNGMYLTWKRPSQLSACADYERVPGTRTLERGIHPKSGYTMWKVVETDEYACIDRRSISGYEIYRTSFGHVYRDGTVELLSYTEPLLIDTENYHKGDKTYAFLDISGDAKVGLRQHNYQIRALYGLDTDDNPDHDYGSRLSEGARVFREHDAARPDARSPQNLTISIPTKQAVADGTALAINLDWDPPTTDASQVTGYVIQRRLVTQSDRALPFADIATITGTGTTSWSDTSSDVTTFQVRSGTQYKEIAPLTQFSYRVIAVRNNGRSNPSAVASTDSERQLPADGLVTVTNVWRTGATIRVDMTGTGLTSNHAKHHLALSPPKRQRENRLLHVGIGAKGWGHHTCLPDAPEDALNEGCTHTDDAYVTVGGLQPGTTYTAEALFRLISEEEYIGGQGAGVKAENFIPTWDGGFYPGGIWSPAHLLGTVNFTTDP